MERNSRLPVIELYSRRTRWGETSQPDIYQYDSLPKIVRNQIAHIWQDAFGPPSGNRYIDEDKAWRILRDTLFREHGLPPPSKRINPGNQCIDYLYSDRSIEELLDIVELSFRYIDAVTTKNPEFEWHQYGVTSSARGAVDELNHRMRESGAGYQFEAGQIVRVDNQVIHAEVVRPALLLLADPRFAGAQEEFLSAHAHYRSREYKDAITDANNAFESTLKMICKIKGWQHPDGAQAAHLVSAVREHGLFPDYMGRSFEQLAATLKSGLPVVRNNKGSHGQGSEPRAPPGHVAAYALHLAAAKIVFLVESLKESGGA